MVGNSVPPLSNEPRKPATWGDTFRLIGIAIALLIGCVGVVAWAIIDILNSGSFR